MTLFNVLFYVVIAFSLAELVYIIFFTVPKKVNPTRKNYQPSKQYFDPLTAKKNEQSFFMDDFLNCQYSWVSKFFGKPVSELTTEEKMFWTLRHIHAIDDELSELRNETNWKWWKLFKGVNINDVEFEIIDLFFFWLSLCLIWGIDGARVEQLFKAKLAENIRRQEEGY